MYAKLAEEGIVVQNYWEVKSFGALLQQVQVNGSTNGNHSAYTAIEEQQPVKDKSGSNGSVTSGAGIDIEEISSMPKANDFREDEFYKMNFTSAEMAYCILQPDPYASFAGLFAAKEAIVKADNHYKNRPFNTIEIEHLQDGSPAHSGFRLSISHTGQTAVAVAIQARAFMPHTEEKPAFSQATSGTKNTLMFWLAVISLLVSLATVVIVLTR
jgi:phosphopantetheine--protein transferase-like protein